MDCLSMLGRWRFIGIGFSGLAAYCVAVGLLGVGFVLSRLV